MRQDLMTVYLSSSFGISADGSDHEWPDGDWFSYWFKN